MPGTQRSSESEAADNMWPVCNFVNTLFRVEERGVTPMEMEVKLIAGRLFFLKLNTVSISYHSASAHSAVAVTFPGTAACLWAALAVFCPLQLSSYSPKNAQWQLTGTTSAGSPCGLLVKERVPLSQNPCSLWLICFLMLLLWWLIWPWPSTLRFVLCSVVVEGPAGCVSLCSFVQLPQGKNWTEPTGLLGERGLLKSAGSLSPVQVPRKHRSLCGIVGHSTSHVEVPTSSVFCTIPPW